MKNLKDRLQIFQIKKNFNKLKWFYFKFYTYSMLEFLPIRKKNYTNNLIETIITNNFE